MKLTELNDQLTVKNKTIAQLQSVFGFVDHGDLAFTLIAKSCLTTMQLLS